MAQLERAYTRLQEALEIPLSEPLALDGTIKRFEFTFEIAWKALKTYLETEGIIARSPRGCLREAFRIGWIHEEGPWLSLLQARNMTSHVYSEEMAMEIYREVQRNHSVIEALIRLLQGIPGQGDNL
ncbi:MAG: nucleotidyltransferase substrate binding protein [Deltaproteobacteria bacterium]|nr:nucleotidyltransferase substrate binding protein [Deltaproteobacteria bacterium]